MTSSSRDFVTVDMRGLKAALMARARAERVSVSVVVRRAVLRELRLVDASMERGASAPQAPMAGSTVKLSIRLTGAEAEQLVVGARQAGLSRGAFIVGLVAGIPALMEGSASRPECLAALNASCAELSTLSRNLHHLAVLLRHGQVRAAMEYRRMLDTLVYDVRRHLELASGVLAELRPPRLSKHEGEHRAS